MQYDPERNREALQFEKMLNPDETPEELANRLLREALPDATITLVHLALTSENPRTRQNARRYLDKHHQAAYDACRKNDEE